MTAISVTKSQWNGGQFNDTQWNKRATLVSTVPDLQNRGTVRSQWGFGHFGHRRWNESSPYRVRIIRPGQGVSVPIISIQSSAGGLLGTIRSDVPNTPIRSVEFTIRNGDCRDFKITMNKVPSFPVVAFSFVTINVGNSSRNWYFGKILKTPENGDGSEEEFIISGTGLSADLDTISGEGFEFDSLSDVGAAVDEIVGTRVATELKIRYNPLKINTTTGIPFAGDVDLGTAKLSKVFETFATQTNHDFGVDTDGDFFFLPKNTNVTKVYVAGHSIHELEVKSDPSWVRNKIIGKRNKPKGSGGVGWVIGAESNDVKSQRKYGKVELPMQFPGMCSDEDLQLLCDNILEQRKEPRTSVKAKTYFVRDQLDYVERGSSRFILPYKTYDVEYQSCDDPVTDFTKFGSGDLTISEDGINFMDGSNSLLLEWTSANGDRAQVLNAQKGTFEKLRFYMRGSTAGIIARVGIGNGVWDDFVKDIAVPAEATDAFVPFTWDLRGLGIKKIDRLAIQIITGTEGTLNIDRIHFDIKGFRHIVAENTQQKYMLGSDETSIELENGPIPYRLEGYLAALFAQQEEARFSGENR